MHHRVGYVPRTILTVINYDNDVSPVPHSQQESSMYAQVSVETWFTNSLKMCLLRVVVHRIRHFQKVFVLKWEIRHNECDILFCFLFCVFLMVGKLCKSSTWANQVCDALWKRLKFGPATKVLSWSTSTSRMVSEKYVPIMLLLSETTKWCIGTTECKCTSSWNVS